MHKVGFTLRDGQVFFRESTRKFLEAEVPTPRVRVLHRAEGVPAGD